MVQCTHFIVEKIFQKKRGVGVFFLKRVKESSKIYRRVLTVFILRPLDDIYAS